MRLSVLAAACVLITLTGPAVGHLLGQQLTFEQAQAINSEANATREKSIQLYNQKKYDEAFKLAGRAVELYEKPIPVAPYPQAHVAVAACRKTTGTLAGVVGRAADEGNADRAAEFGGHLEAVVRDALIPTLDEGRRTVPAESQDAARLRELREQTWTDLGVLRDGLPTTGKVGESEQVKQLRGKLDALRKALEE